jgi:hypothetical protein
MRSCAMIHPLHLELETALGNSGGQFQERTDAPRALYRGDAG